jgi:hypothetical protein
MTLSKKPFTTRRAAFCAATSKLTFVVAKGLKPGVNEIRTNQADLAEPAFPAARPSILPRLWLDLLGIGLFEESRQLGAELREVIKQLYT